MSEEATHWLIVLGVIALVFWVLVRDNSRLRNRTRAEYEQDVLNAQSSLLRAGMLELDKFAGETKQKRAAVEYLKDEEQGQTRTGGNDDDADRTEAYQEPDAPDAGSPESDVRATGATAPADGKAAAAESDRPSVGDPNAGASKSGEVEEPRPAGRGPKVRPRRDST
jgi:hypothetical protein